MPDGPEDPRAGMQQDIHPARDVYVAGRDLTIHYHAAGAGEPERAAGGPVLVGDVPQQPPGFQPRAELLAGSRPRKWCMG